MSMSNRTRTGLNTRHYLNYNGGPQCGHTWTRVDTTGKLTKSDYYPAAEATGGVSLERIVDYAWTDGTDYKTVNPPTSMYTSQYYRDNPRFKLVDHVKKYFTANHGSQTIDLPSVAFPTNKIVIVGLHPSARDLWSFGTSFRSKCPNFYDESFRFGVDPIARSFQEMRKDTSLLDLKDTNLFTSIGELKDFKKLPSLFTKHKLDRAYVGDKYLGVQFGVLPVIGDVSNYIHNIRKTAPNLKRWNDFARKGKIMARHRTFFKDGGAEEFSISTGIVSSVPQNWYIRCDYSYTYDIVGKTHLYFRPLVLGGSNIFQLQSSIYGLNRPLTAAWNLIPFSFMFDWVTNIDDYIERLEGAQPTVRLNTLSAGYSLKLKTNTTCRVYAVCGGKEYLLGTTEKRLDYFRRYPYTTFEVNTWFNEPLKVTPEFKPELNGFQVSIVAALATTLRR